MDQMREAIYYRQGIWSLLGQKSKGKWHCDDLRYASKDREAAWEAECTARAKTGQRATVLSLARLN
jgi:hypothetical protein